MMMSSAGLVALFAVIGLAKAVTIGDFQKVTDGVYDAWKTANPENVQGSFGTIYGNDHLYLISKRLYRRLDGPWDPASRGGIVSTYRLSNNSWTHNPYDRLDEDQYSDHLFWMNGRLFMLTYSKNQQRIRLHKLFTWDDESGQWLETPIEIDPAASTITAVDYPDFSLNVPDPDGTVAYLVSSAPRIFDSGSELAFSRLNIDFRGNVPIKASLHSMGHFRTREPSSVVFTAVHNGSLYALINSYYSEGPVPQKDKIIALNLQSYIAHVLNLKGHPPMDFQPDRMFQLKDQILLVGGSRMVGLTEMEEVKDIWSLDLSKLQWNGTNSKIPNGVGSGFAFDPKNGKLYSAGLVQGINVASVIT